MENISPLNTIQMNVVRMIICHRKRYVNFDKLFSKSSGLPRNDFLFSNGLLTWSTLDIGVLGGSSGIISMNSSGFLILVVGVLRVSVGKSLINVASFARKANSFLIKGFAALSIFLT